MNTSKKIDQEKLLLKRKKEKAILLLMLDIYYAHHKLECNNAEKEIIKNYSFERIDKCPFMATKTFCSKCKVHCYNKEMRMLIKKIMRYSGPRMLFHHPFLLLKHLFAK